jgi:O-antigen/teichoic acid export membrane protein
MTKAFLSDTASGSIRFQSLAKDTGVAILIQALGLVLVYLSRVYLARWMGDTEYGIYEYVLSWTLLLATVAGLGLPRTVLRFVSQYRVKQAWGLLRGIIRGSWWTTVAAGMVVALLGTIAVLILDHYYSFIYAKPLLVGIWLIPLQALMNLQLETARALDDVTLAYAPSQIIWPVLVLGAGFFLLQERHEVASFPLVAAATALLFAVIVWQLWLLGQKLNEEVSPSPPVYAHREWMKVALVLLLQNAFVIVLQQTDIVMVGSILGPEQAGIYGAAVKTAMWVAVVLQTINMVAAPAFTMLYTQDDFKGLQELVAAVTLWIFWPSLGIALILLTFAAPIMGWFGPSFVAGTWSLKILVLGQLVSALCGSVGYLMAMTGHQNKSVVVFGSAALTNLVLNAFAIPIIGAVGAAMTTAFTMIIWNVWLSVLVVRYVGVSPSVFYQLFKGTSEPVS